LFTLIRFAKASADSLANRLPSNSNHSNVLFDSKNLAIYLPRISVIFFLFITRHLSEELGMPSIDLVIEASRRLI